MDQQQNYEYGDSSSFGYLNSFSGSDWPQGQQQLNGKMQSSVSPTQSFDPGDTTASEFTAQPPADIFHTSSNFAPSQQASLIPQNDSIFSVENPPADVPANIIEQFEIIKDDENQPAKESVSIHDSQSLDKTSSVNPIMSQPITLADAETGETSTSNISAQNNVMHALGVVRKATFVPAKGSKKRRRRIMQLADDDSEEEDDLKNEILLSSPEKDNQDAERGENSVDSTSDRESDDDPSIANDPEALKARSLLKSAVIIKGPESKKKKKRVLESDDEDLMQTSVDDIGMVDTNDNENEDDEMLDDMIVDEPVFECTEKPEDFPEVQVVIPDVTAQEDLIKLVKSEQPTENIDKPELQEGINETLPDMKKEEKDDHSVESDDVKSTIKSEAGEIDPSMSVEAVLENIKPMADDDEFFKSVHNSDDSDVQIVPNEEYFGTPDVMKAQ
jgi:hypothetical protein